MAEEWTYTEAYDLPGVGAILIEDGNISFSVCGMPRNLKPDELRAIVRKLNEIEGVAVKSVATSPEDDPESEYWEKRFKDASDALTELDKTQAIKTAYFYDENWTCKALATIYETVLAETKRLKGGAE